jgi:hypothetical protein|tara:strand:+ start:162 stop:611 length:450 start_codon:yes stop_codon:yes gene_type:complete
MIRFFPSKRIKKETDIDFELLGKICTDIFERGFGRKINIECKVWKSKVKEQSTMERTKGRCHYVMDLDTEGNRRYVFGSILHELRHAFQEYVFNFTTVARFASYNAYYNSKEEKDARKQERLTTEVMKIYDTFKKAEEKFERFNLKELG